MWFGIPACHTIPVYQLAIPYQHTSLHTSLPGLLSLSMASIIARTGDRRAYYIWHCILLYIINLSNHAYNHRAVQGCNVNFGKLQTHINGDQHVVRLNILWLQQGTSDKAKASIVVCLSLLVELWRSSSSVCKLYFVQPQMQYGGNGAGCLVDFSEGWISIITCGKFFQQDILEGLCSLPKKKKKALANYQMKLENLDSCRN